jgi:IS4 transposase
MTFKGVNDLNFPRAFRHCFGTFPGGADAQWQSGFRTTHGVRAVAYVSPFGGEVSRRFQRAHVQLRGPISVDGLAQLTYRESLRDIEACLRAQPTKLYHMGLRGTVSRSALADANERRDWRIYAEFAHALIRTACRLYAQDSLSVDLAETVYALDATTIDLCLSLFPWAKFRTTKAAVKLHTLLDLRGAIPSFIHISDGKLHDVNVLDVLIAEPGAFYVMDRAYVDFERLYRLHQCQSFFVTRAKSNFKCKRVYSRPVNRSTGLICDQEIHLVVFYSQRAYPERLRRIRYRDATGRGLVFLTNHMTLPPLTICELYRLRWHVELFFKWIKQHLRIKRFFGTSENAVKTQIWIAVAVYALVAIVRKRLNLELSLHEMTDPQRHALRENANVSAPYCFRTQRKFQPQSQPTDFIVKRVGH